jgi:hypothetical protein
VFGLPIFKHPKFLEIVAQVRDAENREIEAASIGRRTDHAANVDYGVCHILQKIDKKLDTLMNQRSSSSEFGFGSAKPVVQDLFEPRGKAERIGARRLTRAEHVDPTREHVYLIPLSQHQNVAEMWREYVSGPNALRLVNERSGGKCFDYGSTRKRWSEQRCLYKFVERRIAQGISETDAIRALQNELDKLPRTRKKNSGKPNWKALLRSISKMPESQEDKKRKRCRSLSTASEIPSESMIIDVRRDGSVEETDPCVLPCDARISVAPAHAAGSIPLALTGTVARPFAGFAL